MFKVDDNKYIYMYLPKEYYDVYKQMLVKLSAYGKNLLDDCKSSCKGDNRITIHCWNLLQAAFAAYNLAEYKKATLFINYVIKQCKLDVNPVKVPELKFDTSCEVCDDTDITMEIELDNDNTLVTGSYAGITLTPIIKKNGIPIEESEYSNLVFKWTRDGNVEEDNNWNNITKNNRMLVLEEGDIPNIYTSFKCEVEYNGTIINFNVKTT